MEWKHGGRTIAIGGKQVCGCGAPVTPRHATRGAERALIERAVRRYGESTKLFKQLDGVEQWDRDAVELAEFALATGRKLLDRHVGELQLKWFRQADEPQTRGFMYPGRPEVWIERELRGEQLVKTALHELRHHGQALAGTPEAEVDARTFADRWGPAVHAAFRYSEGDPRRLSVTSARNPPFPGDYRHGDVVLQRGRAECWWLNRRASGEPWQRVG